MSESSDSDTLTKNNSGVQLLTRIAAGALVALSASFGWPAIVAAGIITTLLYSYQEYRSKKVYHQSLLDLYRSDLAQLYGKSPDSVTLDDMYQAARPLQKGGMGIVTLQKQIRSDTRERNLGIASEALSSLFISTVIITLSAAGIFVFPKGPLGIMHISFGTLVGGAFALGHQFIDSTMDKWFGLKDADDKPINIAIANIAQTITKGPVQGVDIFSVLVKANPELRKTIKANNGADFDKLPLKLKQQIMQSYDATYRTEALTAAINAAEIKPSFLGFLAYGQVDEKLTDYRKYRQLFSSTADTKKHVDIESKHAKRILSEEKTPDSERVLH